MTLKPLSDNEVSSFWQRQLNDALSSLDPLRDRRQTNSEPPRLEYCDNRVAAETAPRLLSLAAEVEATLAELLLAAFQVLLFRYTGKQDFLLVCDWNDFNIPDAQPSAHGHDPIFPVRALIDEDEPFLDLLRRVRANFCEGRRHGPLSLRLLAAILSPDPADIEAGHRLVRFSMVPAIDDRTDTVAQGNELSLIVSTAESGLPFRFVYDTRHYQSDTIQWMSRHYRRLLDSIVQNPQSGAAELEMATPEEKAMVRDWSHGAPGPGECAFLHERLEEQAEQRPDAPAVVYPGGQLSYWELNRRANQLAHYLQALGVGPNRIVALCLERSPELVIATMAVYKAGGTLLFLAPSTRSERLGMQLGMTEPVVVLTQKAFLGDLGDTRARVVCLDEEIENLSRLPETPLENHATAKDTVIVLFTSGSTGLPKVVADPYGYIRAKPATGVNDRHVLKSSAGTTFTGAEAVAFVNGGTLYIAPKGVESDIQSLVSFIGEHKITYLLVAPSALEVLLSLDDLGPCQSLRTVFCIGEKIKPELKRRFFERLKARLLVGYGCSEARGATSRWCSPDDDHAVADSGCTNPTMEVFVLDAKQRPVPVGIPGEAYIGGQIARGYLNDPAATAQRFIPHPFSSKPGARLFRTGDRARWLPGGRLEILDRLDRQVKIRGYRVELGEIEAVLSSHGEIRQTVLTSREGLAGGKSLIACVVPREEQAISPGDLRRFLQKRLPDYMVPSAFVILKELPLLENGKIDRRALPSPDRSSVAGGQELLRPRNAVESRLLRIWEETLGVRPIGLDDNFFDLGGHSLLAVKLFSAVEKEFRQRLPLATLFHSPTAGQLARLLNDKTVPFHRSSLVPIQPEGSRPPLFCIHALSGEVLFYRKLALLLGPDQPVYGLRAVGLDGDQPPLRSVEEMAQSYIEEVRALQPEGPYCLGGFCLGAYVAFEMARKLEEEAQDVALLASFDADGAWRTVRSFRDAVAYHFTCLPGSGWKAKAGYVLQRLHFRWLRIKSVSWSAFGQFLLDLGIPLSRKLLVRHIAEIHYKANCAYVPRPYGGAVTCFQTEESAALDPSGFWGEVARTVEIRRIPGQRDAMFSEPAVADLAQQLRSCMEKTTRAGLKR